MDPISHMAAGLVVAQLLPWEEAEQPLALAIAVVVSQLPDLDFLAKKIGSSTLFLTLHHKLSHSLLFLFSGGIVLALFLSWLFPIIDVWRMSMLITLVLFSHVALDTLIHSAGISLFWPFSDRKVTVSAYMGPNPMTTSAQCGRRSLIVCVRCQVNGSRFSIPFYILVIGAGLSVIMPVYNQLFALVTVIALTGYVTLTLLLKKRAASLWGSHPLTASATRKVVAPGGMAPWLWYGLAESADRTISSFIDVRRGWIGDERVYQKDIRHPLIEISTTTETIQDFLREAMFPHVTVHKLADGTEVRWRELSYAFAPDVPLYLARVTFASDGTIINEEFRERWDTL